MSTRQKEALKMMAKSRKMEVSELCKAYKVIKTTKIDYCESYGVDFKSKEVVDYALIDNMKIDS